MIEYLLAPLRNTLRPHFDLSKTRLEAMVIILFGLANGRTVSLTQLASQFPGTALPALDRTNRKPGKTDINIPALAIGTRRWLQ